MGGIVLADFERNGTDASVAATTIALAHLGKIDGGLAPGPGIGSDRNFHSKRTLTDAHAVDRVGMQVIRNEFIVPLEIEIGDVEVNGAVFFFRALPQNLDRALVALQ